LNELLGARADVGGGLRVKRAVGEREERVLEGPLSVLVHVERFGDRVFIEPRSSTS